MKFIDAHHHTWDLSVFPYTWMDDPHPIGDISALKNNYVIKDLLEDSENLELFKSVHVQCGGGKDSAVEETEWLQSLADKNEFPHAFVVYSDLLNENIESEIEQHCSFKNTRGLRYLLNYDSKDPTHCFAPSEVLLNNTWKNNYSLLEKYNLSFDLHLYWNQYQYAFDLIKLHPNILNIIDHAGTPRQRDSEYLDHWRNGLKLLASLDNIVMKISGLGMFDQQWTTESIRPLVLDCVDIFGVDRCIFASNFPVDRLFSSYEKVWTSYFEITNEFSTDEKEKLFYKNSEKFYRI